jgi:hypothetical protein
MIFGEAQCCFLAAEFPTEMDLAVVNIVEDLRNECLPMLRPFVILLVVFFLLLRLKLVI